MATAANTHIQIPDRPVLLLAPGGGVTTVVVGVVLLNAFTKAAPPVKMLPALANMVVQMLPLSPPLSTAVVPLSISGVTVYAPVVVAIVDGVCGVGYWLLLSVGVVQFSSSATAGRLCSRLATKCALFCSGRLLYCLSMKVCMFSICPSVASAPCFRLG